MNPSQTFKQKSSSDAYQRVTDMKNWCMLRLDGKTEWFYIQNDDRSMLMRVDNIFSDYSLLNCNWHDVIWGGWCINFPDLHMRLLDSYTKWTSQMFDLVDRKEDDEVFYESN